MRVTLISQVPPPIHGSSMMTLQLLATLDRLGYESALVDRRFSREINAVGAFSIRKLFSALWLICRLSTEIVTRRPRVIILFATNRSFSFIVDCVMATVLRTVRARTLLYVHSSGWAKLSQRGQVWRFLVRTLLRTANIIVVLSPSLASDLRAAGYAGKIEIVSNATEAPKNVVRDKSYCLFFSNLIPNKGPLDFIEIASLVSKELPDERFLLAGAGTSVDFTRAVAEAASASSATIEIYGGVTDTQEKWDLLAGAKALVFPSSYRFEAQPLTIIESLAAGTPVVAYDTGAIAQLIEDGHDGYVVDALNVEAAADRLTEMLRDHGLRESLGRNAIATYRARYSPPVFDAAWRRVIDENYTGGPKRDRI